MGRGRSIGNNPHCKIKSFVWKNICCRFGIPYAIITNNDKQFDSDTFQQFCDRLEIKLLFASPKHPQSNDQVEAINKIIKRIMKRELNNGKGIMTGKVVGGIMGTQNVLPDIHWKDALFTCLQVRGSDACKDRRTLLPNDQLLCRGK